jgi:hypothetical protein
MKKLKITKEQYKKLTDAGLIKEGASFDTDNPVNKSFKKAFAGKDISNFKYIPEEAIEKKDSFKIQKRNTSIPILNINEVENFIKYVYGVNEEFSQYWGENNLAYEDLCEALESKGLFIRKENTYRIPKSSGTPDETKKAIHETLSEMLNHNMEEDYPAGAKDDSRAPYNQPDPITSIGNQPENKDYEVVYNNTEFSILKNKLSDDMFAFNHTNIDKDAFNDYAEKQGFIDADGDMEYYDDWEVDDAAIERYFNDVLASSNVGEGADAFMSGEYDIVKIDGSLKNELLDLYDKDKKLVSVLNTVTESTTAASVGGSFVAPMSGGPISKGMPVDDDKLNVKVVYEMDTADAGNIGYDNPGFAGISRDGDFPKNRKKTKAEEKTQWAGGSFVDIDDCTKLNNNKKAQNGGCSTGAVDNVVKQIKTSGNVNAPSLNEGMMREALKLQHDKTQNKLIVLSDLEGRAASQETFHNKAVLKQNGFNWWLKRIKRKIFC